MKRPNDLPMRDGEPGFPTPEEVALCGYSPSARAHVVRIEQLSESVVHVIVDTEPSHPMRVYCELDDGYWYETGSGSE